MDLKEFLARERAQVDEALRDALRARSPAVPVRLRPALRHGVLSGGKRLRPILCVAAYRAAGGTHGDIYPLAVSLELIHAGEPTTHQAHGEAETMAAGGLLIPLAARQAWDAAIGMGLGEAVGRRLVAELSKAAGGGGMVGGQVLDLLGEESTLSASELDDLHRRKTGALLRAALLMGGIAARAENKALEALDAYGKAIGLAFQIADDLLDATSSAQALGKVPSDADLGKSTYVTLFGVEEASKKAQALVDDAVGALELGGLTAPELDALARYIVERRK